MGQSVILDDFDLFMSAAYPNCASQRTGFDTLRRGIAAEFDALIAICGINVPRVELARNIRIQPELVAAPSQNLAAKFLVEKRRQRAVGIYLKPKALGLQ